MSYDLEDLFTSDLLTKLYPGYRFFNHLYSSSLPSLSFVTLSTTALSKEVPPFNRSARVTVVAGFAGAFLGAEQEAKIRRIIKRELAIFIIPGLLLKKLGV
jgi:hypothetical protein